VIIRVREEPGLQIIKKTKQKLVHRYLHNCGSCKLQEIVAWETLEGLLLFRRHNYSNTKKTRLVSSLQESVQQSDKKIPTHPVSSKAVQEITQAKRPPEEASFLCIADCGRVLNSQEVSVFPAH